MAESKNNELKMCQACRALIPASAKRCEMCGAEGHYAERESHDEAALGSFSVWPVTTLILSLNVLVYAVVLLYQARLTGDGAPGFTITPDLMVSDWFGASHRGIFENGQWWRLLASCFLHGGPIHLLFNSMALIQAGRLAETIFGRAQFICLYFLTGIGGNLLAIVLGKQGVLVVGASGAIFGLIGALGVYGYRRGDLLGQSLRQDMGYWLLYGLAMSFLPGLNISWQAHLGGAVVGAVLALVLRDMETLRQHLTSVRIAQAFAVIAWLGLGVTGILAARNVVHENQVERVREVDSRVVTIRRNHQYLGDLLEAAALSQEKQVTLPPNWPDLPTLARRIDQTYKAMCSDTGALERLPVIDEQSTQLFGRMAKNLRARCDNPPPPPRADEPASFAAYRAQAEKGQELDQLMGEYQKWQEQIAARLGLPLVNSQAQETVADPANKSQKPQK